MSSDEQALLAAIIADPESDTLRLVYADFLEENGQAARAKFIRARLVLDGGRPEFGAYADALKALMALVGCARWEREVEVPEGFEFFPTPNPAANAWWETNGYASEERGMPSIVITAPGVVEPAVFSARLGELLGATTVRGLQLIGAESWERENVEAVVAAPQAAELRRLDFRAIQDESGGRITFPMLAALAGSPVARDLEWLTIRNGETTIASIADELAAIPFGKLRRLELDFLHWDQDRAAGLAAAPWFAELSHLNLAQLDPLLGRPPAMLRLHTLCLYGTGIGEWQSLARNLEAPNLRRLYVRTNRPSVKWAETLGHLRCGELVELVLWCPPAAPVLTVLLAAPWAQRLEVLLFIHDGDGTDHVADVLDASPCANTLRVWGVSY